MPPGGPLAAPPSVLTAALVPPGSALPGPAGSAWAFTYKAPCAESGPTPSLPPSRSLSPALGTPRGAAGAGRYRSRAHHPAGAHLGESGRAAVLASPVRPGVESARSRRSFPPQSPVEGTHSLPEVGHSRVFGNWGHKDVRGSRISPRWRMCLLPC